MPPADDKKALSGLARSIDTLFTRGDESSDELPDVPDALAAPAVADDSEAGPDALARAVGRYLDAPPSEREGPARELREAAAALAEAGSPDSLADAVERLARGGVDADDEAPAAMARSLLTPDVADRLAARLATSREEDRHAELVGACARLGRDMADALAEALSNTLERFARRAYVDAIGAMGDDGIAVTQEMVEDGRWFVVRNAATILGEIGGERAVALLTGSLAHQDARVRREALHALARIGGDDARQLVSGMIEDPDADVRLAAAVAAGALKVSRALKPLLALLEDEDDPDVVVGVLRALGQLADPEATNAIEKRAVRSFFSRPPTNVRVAALRALHSIGTPRAKRLVMSAVNDKDPRVKAAVRHLLSER